MEIDCILQPLSYNSYSLPIKLHSINDKIIFALTTTGAFQSLAALGYVFNAIMTQYCVFAISKCGFNLMLHAFLGVFAHAYAEKCDFETKRLQLKTPAGKMYIPNK